jgi:hypothetical protein
MADLRWPLLRQRAKKEPLGVDLSDSSDEFVNGFLAGQVNMLDWLASGERDAEDAAAALRARVVDEEA